MEYLFSFPHITTVSMENEEQYLFSFLHITTVSMEEEEHTRVSIVLVYLCYWLMCQIVMDRNHQEYTK